MRISKQKIRKVIREEVKHILDEVAGVPDQRNIKVSAKGGRIDVLSSSDGVTIGMRESGGNHVSLDLNDSQVQNFIEALQLKRK